MASAYVPIQGPFIKHAFAKSVYKGEDFWLQNRDLRWTSDNKAGGTLEALGVFDGHGGKGAGQYAAKHMMPAVLSKLKESPSKSTGRGMAGEAGLDSELAGGNVDAWQLQDAAVEQLPEALSQGFRQIQQDFFASSKQSGTTATLVTVVGWDVLVANVGDSCAYLDTGSEVLQVSGNHRLDDSKQERERVEAAGSNVSQSLLDGKPVGPMRVWPGGLAMSRSIGDHEAGAAVMCEPEVRHLVLPEGGGRLIIASDGLWDAINPKTAAHHVRGTPASKAAHDLVQAALKKRGLRDDITVIVIDACPSADDRMPAALLSRKGSGGSYNGAHMDSADRVHIRKPLEESFMSPRNEEVGQRRLAAARAMLAQSDDLSSLSSSPWSSTISSLSDSSAFQLSSSLEATSSLQAGVGGPTPDDDEEEEEEEESSEPERSLPAPLPMSDVEEDYDDGGWETVAKPSSKASQAQERLDEAVQNLEIVDEAPAQPQAKLHKPDFPAGRGRGHGRSSLRRGRQARPGFQGQHPAQVAGSEANVRVVPRPPPRFSQPQQQGSGPAAAERRQGSRGRGRGRRPPQTASSPHEHGSPLTQTGFEPAQQGQGHSGYSRGPPPQYHRRGRGGNTRRTRQPDQAGSEHHDLAASKFRPQQAANHPQASSQGPPIQFGQFAASN